MKRTKLYIGLLLVFTLGALFGALGMGLYITSRPSPFMHEKPEARVGFLMERFTHNLDLTEEQKPKIESILRDMDEEMRTFRKDAFPKLEKIIEKHRERIRQTLTQEQRKIFDEMHERMKRRGPGFGAPDGPPPPGGPWNGERRRPPGMPPPPMDGPGPPPGERLQPE